MRFPMRQHLALVVLVARGIKVDSLTATFTVSSSSTSYSCQATNLAACFSGGVGTLIYTLYLRYSLCSEYRNIFTCTAYGSGNVKQDSAGGKMREWARARQLEARAMTSEAGAMIAGTALSSTAAGTGVSEMTAAS